MSTDPQADFLAWRADRLGSWWEQIDRQYQDAIASAFLGGWQSAGSRSRPAEPSRVGPGSAEAQELLQDAAAIALVFHAMVGQGIPAHMASTMAVQQIASRKIKLDVQLREEEPPREPWQGDD